MHTFVKQMNSLLKLYETGYQSTRHTVISSHGHVVTRSTRLQSTRHRHIFWVNSSHSQVVTQSSRPVVKVDRRIRWHYSDYTITILCFRIGARQHEVSKL